MWRRRARTLALASAFGLLLPAVAGAESIAYFNGLGQVGFDNSSLGLAPQLVIDGQSPLLGLKIKQKVKQAKAKDGSTDVRIKLKVKNKTKQPLDLLLLVTALTQPVSDPISLDLMAGKKNKKQIPLEIVQLQQGNLTRYFAGLMIDGLLSGKKLKTQLSYHVDGKLSNPALVQLTAGTGIEVLPEVPEPGTGVMLGAALVALAARRRRR